MEVHISTLFSLIIMCLKLSVESGYIAERRHDTHERIWEETRRGQIILFLGPEKSHLDLALVELLIKASSAHHVEAGRPSLYQLYAPINKTIMTNYQSMPQM